MAQGVQLHSNNNDIIIIYFVVHSNNDDLFDDDPSPASGRGGGGGRSGGDNWHKEFRDSDDEFTHVERTHTTTHEKITTGECVRMW